MVDFEWDESKNLENLESTTSPSMKLNMLFPIKTEFWQKTLITVSKKIGFSVSVWIVKALGF